MCGLVGFWEFKNPASLEARHTFIEEMTDTLFLRGPDSYGVWCDPNTGLNFGHRRLTIVDLSKAGHQPMFSGSGASVIIYNGEIYNNAELREALVSEGATFKGHSDTETLVEACERWGVSATCQKLIGMFAFAFFDIKQKRLFLARDRLGKKPLYYGIQNNTLFFGSQMKSFRSHPRFQAEMDKDALATYFRFNYIPAPLSIFKGIRKLTPGNLISVDEKGHLSSEESFWDLTQIIANRKIREIRRPEDEINIETELEILLKDAVKRRMMADVPLGAFLSGGIDSSTVVSLMQAESMTPVKTFSIGFQESSYNEAPYAKAVANHLRTEHHELYVTPEEASALVNDIPDWFDEPFADVSQIPTFLVSKLAREHVKVSLSGDGGDELFLGYNRYFVGRSLFRMMRFLPIWLRSLGVKSIRSVSPQMWDNFIRCVPAKFRPILFSDKLYKMSHILESQTPEQFYRLLMSQWPNPNNLVKQGKEECLFPWSSALNTGSLKNLDFVETLQYQDCLNYLPDDILAKVDRASMAVSLEARTPLLDHRVVEFAWKLPMEMKFRNNKGKWVLRNILNRYVPSHLIDRPKMGFGVPIDSWLRGSLRPWAEDLLFSDTTLQNYLNTSLVKERWEEHQSGKRNWQYALWGVLMFEAFRRKWAA